MAARITLEIFLERAKQRFGDLFDYSEIQWRSYKSPVKIRCRKHPVHPITITPEKHLQTTGGCRHCLRERRVESLERELNRAAASPAEAQLPVKVSK
ncbi:hypothetical protein ACLM45_03810 [Synechococcus sp. A10-1-5-9]|uniref:hypothetical protein n=1 Tax=Synechococcus sp. A10-1-5-9 TaxID=3392295 RepID=UPI0039E97B49